MALNIEHKLKVLIEITSGRNLMIGDISSSDPYVVVKLGEKVMHQTKHISKSLNPEWSPEENSTFILACEEYQLVDADGLTFVVKDYDFIGRDEDLGTVKVGPREVLVEGEMGRMFERKITPPKGSEGKDVGYLTFRIRRPTPEDEKVMASGVKKRMFEVKTGVFDHGASLM